MAGSHDWEDFAYKLEKRGGQCIGIFCSLYDVDAAVYKEARDLSVRHRHAIVIAGETWDHLAENHIELTDFIRYMIMQLRAKMDPTPANAEAIRSWRLDRETARKQVDRWCQSRSAAFLRRHRLPRHKNVYVSREIDDKIASLANALRPSSLTRKQKRVFHGEIELERDRMRPTQVAVIRDLSGAGKTTLAVQAAGERTEYFGAARAALEVDIDDLEDKLGDFGGSLGLDLLEILDRPLVYVIDSLDEASTHPQKRKEVRALFQIIDNLNMLASEHGFLSYPLLLAFTIRDDYWREWESQFEGRDIVKIVRRFSFFTPSQTEVALHRYATAYEYEIEGVLDERSIEVLSHPFNLQIFSESNEYVGQVRSSNILDYKLMDKYFERKKDDLLKRPTVPLSGSDLLIFCSLLADKMLVRRENRISKAEVSGLVKSYFRVGPGQADAFAGLIISEQIIVPTDSDMSQLRFRHMRFIEYLIAFKIVKTLSENEEADIIEQVGDLVSSSSFINLYYIHDFIKSIASILFPETVDRVAEAYTSSAKYMQRVLSARRSDLSLGGQTTGEDLTAIRRAVQGGDSLVCWDAFFVLAARSNQESNENLLEAFQRAWDSNYDREDRWKLLPKLTGRELLLVEPVVKRVVQSRHPKTWEVYLEELDRSPQLVDFPEAWREMGGAALAQDMKTDDTGAWNQVLDILDFAICGLRFKR